jgi:GxxExxY protein
MNTKNTKDFDPISESDEQLAHDTIGMLYTVFRNLGYGYQEKYYQRALATELDSRKLLYRREISFTIKYREKIIGRYRLDFQIDRLVLELKVANEFYEKHIKQVLSYLKRTKLRLAIIPIVTPNGIKVKRVIN